MPPLTTPAPTVASAEPLTTLADSTAAPFTSTDMCSSNPTSRATPGHSNSPLGSTPGISTVSGTLSAATGTEPSSPAASSTQTTELALSTSADLPTMLPVCPTTTSNTSVSHLFLSLRLTVPLDLGNTTVQELLLSKLRGDLQTAFPCAGLAVEWRGKRRT
ncbi:UV excision repair protein RAD23 homolog [Pezoporus flaviventris]|uniref:UV excision repair protein RAD23 homolog n=1 Tax=Pezoporus flaviventris TaxID=889875 RepID=UPI002AAFEA00|nr:UV excision repair protein RAD23 homolog [Pezoporus flaviventris]